MCLAYLIITDMYDYITVECRYNAVQYNMLNATCVVAVNDVEYRSEFTYTKGTPYLALPGELWGVFCEDFGKMYRVITAPYCIRATL